MHVDLTEAASGLVRTAMYIRHEFHVDLHKAAWQFVKNMFVDLLETLCELSGDPPPGLKKIVEWKLLVDDCVPKIANVKL